MVQSGGNERLTAFVSTVVAVAILAAGVKARQGSSPEVTDVVQMGSDLRFQFEMSLRHNERERDARLTQLDAVMAEWQASTQSDADRAALVTWLQEAGANSLPGALKELPAQPEFSRVQTPVEHQVLKAVIPPVESVAKQPQRVETPVTPTATDPLEEEIVALRQPQSLTAATREQPVASTLEVAPRPGLREQPKLVEENLLASVSVSKESDEPIRVNLIELSARIAGYHDSLNEVDTALLRMETANVDTLSEQIQRLEALARDYSFLDLYYESLTDAERRKVLSPRTMESTITEVERQLNSSEAVLDGDFLGSFDKAAEREIAALRGKLAGIRERVER
ncbi:MAG: hypothetical protein SH868_18410 [Bythopirellula sp.]|nr:hypothetical protein [Bythopirellula sp.]